MAKPGVQVGAGVGIEPSRNPLTFECRNPQLPELAKTNQLGESPTDGRRICDTQACSAADDLVESLGSLVEFDGLETTQDPSPRSSLMLSMYNQDKGTFVYRTLTERVIPSCDRFISVFGRRRREFVEEYVRAEYSSEVPFEVLQQQLLSADGE